MKNYLFIVLGVMLALLVLVYAVRWLGSGDRELSPQQLAELALTSDDATARQEAAVKLADAGDGAPEQLRRVLSESQDEQVRATAIGGLAGLFDYDSMPQLLDALEDESPRVRGSAFLAVQRMLGLTRMKFSATRPPAEQKREIQRMRDEWKLMKESPLLDEWKARNLSERQVRDS